MWTKMDKWDRDKFLPTLRGCLLTLALIHLYVLTTLGHSSAMNDRRQTVRLNYELCSACVQYSC